MKPYAENRKARHDYEFLETYEGGLVLDGQETKSVREGGAKLDGSYIKFLRGEPWLVGARIARYSRAGRAEGSDPERSRKVLLHRKEMGYLLGKSLIQGLTLVPVSLYPSGRRIKVSFALAKGRQAHDKRAKLKERDVMRQTSRILRGRDE